MPTRGSDGSPHAPAALPSYTRVLAKALGRAEMGEDPQSRPRHHASWRERLSPDRARLRVGIHSGRALVGDIGAPSRVNYTVVGDVVNAAERLEELARSIVGEGETICVLVSGATAGRLTTDLPLIPLGCRALRGRSETLEVFRLETT